MDNSRRKFLGTSLTGAALAISLPDIVKAAMPTAPSAPKVQLADHDTILFQGDSITDAGRDKENNSPNSNRMLGNGYALLAAVNLLETHAAKQLSIYNKGISGNKVHQLDARWDKDCLTIKPNVLSILIGVNDYWHTLSSGYDGTIQVYCNDYRKLLDRTMEALPDVKLIIGEPFAVNHVKAVTDDWFPAFDEYRAAAREIADAYGAVFIPYQQVFDEAAKRAAPSYWTGDGVHTTLAGAQLMAEAWLRAVN